MSYAINTIKSLPFENIIGGPMTASIKAQSQAAHETISFIKEVGFKPKTDPDKQNADFNIPTLDDEGNADMGDVRNITFSYEAKNEDGTTRTASITVPLLTVIPIPFLRIDELNIDFTAKITEVITRQFQDSSVRNFASRFDASYSSWWSPVRASFSAAYSSRHSSSSSSSSRYSSEMTMNVNVRAVQDDLPAGLSRVLGILEDMVQQDNGASTASGGTT